MKLIYFLGVCIFLLQTPLVFSYSCYDLPEEYEEVCKEISKSDLSYSQKEELILELEKEETTLDENQEEYNSIGLRIKTDKLKYSEGENIEVDITPKDLLVNLDYAGEGYFSIEKRTLRAQPPHNKITATYNEEVYEKIIYVKKDYYEKLFDFIIFFYMIYLISLLIKKYGRKIWQNVVS